MWCYNNSNVCKPVFGDRRIDQMHPTLDFFHEKADSKSVSVPKKLQYTLDFESRCTSNELNMVIIEEEPMKAYFKQFIWNFFIGFIHNL